MTARLVPMMSATVTEPRVITDGLIYHWRDGTAAPFCRAAPLGALMVASQAVNAGLTECPDCDDALRRAGWRAR